jgi:hypothetical protein
MEDASSKAADIAIQETADLLDSVGLTLLYTFNKLYSLCEATKPISCVRGKDAGPASMDFVDVPDNTTQLNAVKELVAIRGLRAPEKREYKHDLQSTVSDHVKAIVKDIAGYDDKE